MRQARKALISWREGEVGWGSRRTELPAQREVVALVEARLTQAMLAHQALERGEELDDDLTLDLVRVDGQDCAAARELAAGLHRRSAVRTEPQASKQPSDLIVRSHRGGERRAADAVAQLAAGGLGRSGDVRQGQA